MKTNNILNIDHVCVNFGGIQAVKDVSIEVETGKIVSLIGPNGAGKTTLFNCITGFNTPDTGDITLNGESLINEKTYNIVKKGVGRTFQNVRLFGRLTVLENVKVGCHRNTKANFVSSILNLPSARKEEKMVDEVSMEALKTVGLDHIATQKAYNQPYGNKRKLEIARALAIKPDLILLDEPAAGMNENETQELMKIITKIREMGITVFLVEHDMKLVMNISDRIFVLNYGQKIAEGSPDEIRKNPAVIEAYLGKE